MVRIWSQPTPRWRSASSAACSAFGGALPSRRSNTTKSLPAPCILLKRMRPVADLLIYASTTGGVFHGLVRLLVGGRIGFVGGGVGSGLLGRGDFLFLDRHRLLRHHQGAFVAAGTETQQQEGRGDENQETGRLVHPRSIATGPRSPNRGRAPFSVRPGARGAATATGRRRP